MSFEDINEFALSLEGVDASFPFGEQTLVYKVASKVFLLVSLDSIPIQFNVKCDPERAIELREEYHSILPGYHMNKKHWNTVIADNSIPKALLKQMIRDSYDLVKQKSKTK